ncbi:MAG: hypothetical protein M3Y48_04260 [Actinomycetota bacterium]|nr:hypothetical protein [Actinomycetota bacterium]
MGEWGPLQKRLADGNELGTRKGFRLMTGDTVWWAECTDGWSSKKYTDYSDAEKEFGKHFGLQHGAK